MWHLAFDKYFKRVWYTATSMPNLMSLTSIIAEFFVFKQTDRQPWLNRCGYWAETSLNFLCVFNYNSLYLLHIFEWSKHTPFLIKGYRNARKSENNDKHSLENVKREIEAIPRNILQADSIPMSDNPFTYTIRPPSPPPTSNTTLENPVYHIYPMNASSNCVINELPHGQTARCPSATNRSIPLLPIPNDTPPPLHTAIRLATNFSIGGRPTWDVNWIAHGVAASLRSSLPQKK